MFCSRGLFLSWVKSQFVSECCPPPPASCCSKNPGGSRRVLVGSVKWLWHTHFIGVWGSGRRSKALYRGPDNSLAWPGRKQLHSGHFIELGGSLPHSQGPPLFICLRQIWPFLCPSHFWQARLVSFLVGLRTYQHPGSEIASWTSERASPSFLHVHSNSNFGTRCDWNITVERYGVLRTSVSCSERRKVKYVTGHLSDVAVVMSMVLMHQNSVHL